MRLLILIVLVLTVSLTSCVENVKNQDEKTQLSLEDSIAKLEDLLFNSEQNKLAKKTAAQATEQYERFSF